MTIQIEPRKDIMEIKPSLDKVTYVSYLSYQAVIPKAPEDVRLSDVKIAFPEEADLEYHFETKDLAGNPISVEVDNNYQPIPMIDGEIKVETVPKKLKFAFKSWMRIGEGLKTSILDILHTVSFRFQGRNPRL